MYSLSAYFLTFGTYKYFKKGARLITSTDNQDSTRHKNKFSVIIKICVCKRRGYNNLQVYIFI